jgi:hypothetical protein
MTPPDLLSTHWIAVPHDFANRRDPWCCVLAATRGYLSPAVQG